MSMKTLKFSNGDGMPILGLGTWKSEPGKVKEAVYEAIKCGYRHIDCASIYQNEAEVGAAIKQALDEELVKREDLWVTSKLWNNAHEREQVKPALQNTLQDLGLDYLDLYLIHWPIAQKADSNFPEKAEDFLALENVPIAETWSAMERLVDEGLCRHIGVSNFSVDKLKRLVSIAAIKPEVNQVELHPYLQQKDMLDYCHNNGINLTGYSPLGSMDRPETLKKEDEPIPMESEVVKGIAKKYDITEAQVLLAWNINRGVAVIPKSTNKERIRENLLAADILLNHDDIRKIDDMDQGYRFVDGGAFDMEGNPYTQNNIWDEESDVAPISG